jgi:L-lactate dehydrogenase (cytochrome)
MTEFLDDHPGGREIITSNRSKDVTPIFRPRHPSDQLEEDNLPPNVHWLGRLDVEGASEEDKSELRLKVSREEEDEESRVKREREKMEERGLGVVVNMKDFEVSRGFGVGDPTGTAIQKQMLDLDLVCSSIFYGW